MDLKSMLNDAATAKQAPPRLHTPQSSFDRSTERPSSYDAHPDRPPSYPPSSHGLDRSQTGGYFASQSPAPNSANTPSTTTQSIYTQSPGPHGHIYTPRDSVPPQHSYPPQHVQSPGPPPSTPGSAQYFQGHNVQSAYSNAHTPTASGARPPTREDLTYTNGMPHSASRQMSPPSFTHQPVTPLGPPVAHPRASPQAQRPLSQGYDHYRKTSVSSIGSSHSREYSAHPMAHHDASRGGSIQRPYLGDEERQRERERSLESVSPKTIPRPAPQRQSSAQSQPSSIDVQPPAHLGQPVANVNPSYPTNGRLIDGTAHQAPIPSLRSVESYPASNASSRPSPGAPAMKSVTPQSAHSSLPAQPSPSVNKQSGLKRSNSILSTPPGSAMRPRKRPRRDDVPIYAQSARRGKPIRFDTNGPKPRPYRNSPAPKHEEEKTAATNGQGQGATTFGLYETYKPLAPGKEPSITNKIPYEDLIRQICDWIAMHIVSKTPPTEGSQFEIEAKLGAIVSQETETRLELPVTSEAILDKSRLAPLRFASTMDEVSVVRDSDDDFLTS